MLKRKLSLFLAVIMLIGMLPFNVFASNAQLAPAKDPSYKEVMIKGRPYKFYKLADVVDKPSKKSPMELKSMARFANSLGAQRATTPKFVLELRWSTIDRDIPKMDLPVYVGPPDEDDSLKLGYFTIQSVAQPGVAQNFDFHREYYGDDPSLDFLIENAFESIGIAVPEDMRYDFTLAPAKWDGKQNYGHQIVFEVQAKQSVMHGYGIRWFDTNQANRDKVDARWEGKENQISDVKLGTEDRDYSVYSNNVIAVQDKNNVKEYPDGTKYSNYDYYYNGKKVTTYADADNLGKYDNELLAIDTISQAPYASLKVKDGVDYKLKGEKVLKNKTKYLYNSVGDYRTFHVLSMREALEVKFNTGNGSLTDGGKANQEIGKAQEIGHSETIANNESGRTIKVPDGSGLIPPKAEAGKPDNEFKGWALSADATTALFKTQEEANAYTTPFTDKTTTFHAIYGPKDEFRAKVEYVYDNNGTETVIDKKYLKDKNDPNYQTIINKKDDAVDDKVQEGDVTVPTFIGFERTNDKIDVTGKTYKNEKDDSKLDVIKVKFRKLDDIIPDNTPDTDDDKPEGYVTVTFKADDDKHADDKARGTLSGTTKYYVNPTKEVTVPAPKVTVKPGYTQKTGADAWDHALTATFAKATTITAQYNDPKDVVPQKPGEDKPNVPDNFVLVEFKADDDQHTGDKARGTIADTETTKYWVNPEKEVTVPAPTVTANPGWIQKTGKDAWDKPLTATFAKATTITAQYNASDVVPSKPEEPRPSAPAITWRGLWFLGDSKSEPVQEMETGRHYKYLYGYVDKTVRPEGMITRSEAAALIARLANLDMTDKTKPDFKDTPSAWYNGAINAMVAKNLMFADKDGNFRPNEPITRGEFARALYYIDKKNDKVAPFADVKGHEFEDAINQAYGNGRIAGYQDGTFKPNANIQRAEAARILNQFADRNVTLAGMANVKNDLVRFTDINESHWAYCEVMEAANSHEYQRAKGTLAETWLKILDK